MVGDKTFAGMYPANFLSKSNHILQIYPFLFLFLPPDIQASYSDSFFETANKKSPQADYSFFLSAWSFEIKCKSSVYDQCHHLKSLPPQNMLNKNVIYTMSSERILFLYMVKHTFVLAFSLSVFSYTHST